jgi:hypothetical protein
LRPGHRQGHSGSKTLPAGERLLRAVKWQRDGRVGRSGVAFGRRDPETPGRPAHARGLLEVLERETASKAWPQSAGVVARPERAPADALRQILGRTNLDDEGRAERAQAVASDMEGVVLLDGIAGPIGGVLWFKERDRELVEGVARRHAGLAVDDNEADGRESVKGVAQRRRVAERPLWADSKKLSSLSKSPLRASATALPAALARRGVDVLAGRGTANILRRASGTLPFRPNTKSG